MKVRVPPGRYVVAVSGGVDSMVLLDILSKDPSIDLIVAHYDHGIRMDSGNDEKLVAATAKRLGLIYEAGKGELGENTSEEQARKYRYSFLEAIKYKYGADGIITAHHQDDLIETAFLNLLRGSGPRGLVAIKINPKIKRPMLNISKGEILEYAKEHKINWLEDSTNYDESYLRNYIRKNITPNLSAEMRRKLISNIEKVAEKSKEKEELIATISHKITIQEKINRSKYIGLPLEIRNELIAYWLRSYKTENFDRKMLEKIDIVLKTGKPGTNYPIKESLWLYLAQNTAHFECRN